MQIVCKLNCTTRFTVYCIRFEYMLSICDAILFASILVVFIFVAKIQIAKRYVHRIAQVFFSSISILLYKSYFFEATFHKIQIHKLTDIHLHKILTPNEKKRLLAFVMNV